MFEMLDHDGPGHFGSSFALGFSEPNFVEKNEGNNFRTNPEQAMASSATERATPPTKRLGGLPVVRILEAYVPMKIQIRQEEVWASQFQRNKACIGTQRMHRLQIHV